MRRRSWREDEEELEGNGGGKRRRRMSWRGDKVEEDEKKLEER